MPASPKLQPNFSFAGLKMPTLLSVVAMSVLLAGVTVALQQVEPVGDVVDSSQFMSHEAEGTSGGAVGISRSPPRPQARGKMTMASPMMAMARMPEAAGVAADAAPFVGGSVASASMQNTFADMQAAQPEPGRPPLSGPVILKDGSMAAEVYSVEKADDAVRRGKRGGGGGWRGMGSCVQQLALPPNLQVRAAVAAIGGTVVSSNSNTDQWLIARINSARAAPGGAEKNPPVTGATSASIQVRSRGRHPLPPPP